jgi:hypothetical protein
MKLAKLLEVISRENNDDKSRIQVKKKADKSRSEA